MAEIVLSALIQIESGGRATVVNPRTGATGLAQITPICLKDFNRHARPLFPQTMKDMLNPTHNKRVGAWYINVRVPELLKAHRLPDTMNYRLACYNWGITNVRRWHKQGAKWERLPLSVRRYIKRYCVELIASGKNCG